MNWDHLRVFITLARSKTVSQAGLELGVEHTTVARRITALEEQLGTRLFDRTRDGYELTAAGEQLYHHAETMEQHAHSAGRELTGVDAELKGSLKLTAPHDVLSRLIIHKLPEFNSIYPSIDLQLLSSNEMFDLTARQADIAIRLTDKPADYLVGREVLPLRHGVYGSVDYFKNRPKRDRIILWCSESSQPNQQPEWVRNHFPDAKVTLAVTDATNMMTAVKSGIGLARLPCFMCDNEEQLLRMDLPLTLSQWRIWVLSHIDLRETARVRVCREFLSEKLLEQRSLVEGTNSRYL